MVERQRPVLNLTLNPRVVEFLQAKKRETGTPVARLVEKAVVDFYGIEVGG
jgi:hypothetical protein